MPRRTEARPLEGELDRLYGLPLDEFTAARNDLARDLKRSGDPAAAMQVLALPKPTRSAGAINRAARRHRRDARLLLEAAARLSEAQEELLRGGDRRSVEQAVERERAAVDRLMAEVEVELGRDGKPTESMRERARNTLHAVATNPELRQELEAGRITKDYEAAGFGALTVGGDASAARRRSVEKSDAQRRLKQAERALDIAERALQRAERSRKEAEERLDAANAAVVRSEQEVAEAAGARDDARSALKRL